MATDLERAARELAMELPQAPDVDDIQALILAGMRKAIEAAAGDVTSKADHYPTDVFREPPVGEHGATIDACSARALRRIAPLWAESILALLPKETP